MLADLTKDKVRKLFSEYFKLLAKPLKSATAKTNFSTLFTDRDMQTFPKKDFLVPICPQGIQLIWHNSH